MKQKIILIIQMYYLNLMRSRLHDMYKQYKYDIVENQLINLRKK